MRPPGYPMCGVLYPPGYPGVPHSGTVPLPELLCRCTSGPLGGQHGSCTGSVYRTVCGFHHFWQPCWPPLGL